MCLFLLSSPREKFCKFAASFMTDEMRNFRRGTFGDQKKINNPREEVKIV